MKLRYGSTFTGYGGFDLAARWLGWKNVFQVEKEKYCKRLLKQNFTGPQLFDDIKKFDAKPFYGTIDIISGGDPCQPSSLQGKGRGKQDHRYLWPEYLRVVKEVYPAWIINENVPGSIFNGILDGKIRDLEAEGYTCWPPLLIPGAAVGTIHQRERVLLVAYAPGWRFEQLFITRIANKPGKRQLSGKPITPATIGIKAGHTSLRAILREANGTAERLAPSVRNGGIKAGGNGVVPQLVFGVMKEIDRITEAYINDHQL